MAASLLRTPSQRLLRDGLLYRSAALLPRGDIDLVVGLAIAAINADAAREVYVAARQERRAAT